MAASYDVFFKVSPFTNFNLQTLKSDQNPPVQSSINLEVILLNLFLLFFFCFILEYPEKHYRNLTYYYYY